MASNRTYNVHEAKTHFSKILKRVARGEEVIIAHAGHPVARLTAFEPKRQARKPGSARGLIEIAGDFDAPLPPDLQRAFEE